MNPLPFKSPRFAGKADSFTLVEVVVAMAIMTVTLVPLMGLMTGGLVEVGSNIDSNEAVDICQQVVTAAQQGSFSALAANANVGGVPMGSPPTSTPPPTPIPTYFTAEGDVAPAGSASIVYTASVTYMTNAVSTMQSSPPYNDPPLVTMVVQVLKTPHGITTKNPPVATFVGTIGCQDVSGFNAGTD
jgi:uncharacterized protein (TIGR02598 family)